MDRVYVLVNPDNKRVKIGVTQDIEQRLYTLRMASGSKIYVFYITPILNKAYTLETITHKYFASKRFLGEWFNIDPNEAVRFIKTQEKFFIKKDMLAIKTNIEIDKIIRNHEESLAKRKKRDDVNSQQSYNNKIQEINDFEEHVLTEPLTRFKKLESNVYFRKSTKEYFDIRYKNHQWIIRRLK